MYWQGTCTYNQPIPGVYEKLALWIVTSVSATTTQGTFVTLHLNSLTRKLEEARRDGYCARVFGVDGGQESCRLATKVLLVVNETLRVEGDVALAKVIDHGPVTAVLLHEGRLHELALNDVQNLLRA